MIAWPFRRRAQKPAPQRTAAPARVQGFLLDECVGGLATRLQQLGGLPVCNTVPEHRGKSDEFVHGLAYAKEYAIITEDTGRNDGSGFCTKNGWEVARRAVILLPAVGMRAQLEILSRCENEIILYLGMPDRIKFYLDLRGDDPLMSEWGAGLKRTDQRKEGGSPALQSSQPAPLPFDGITGILTSDGLRIATGDQSKLNVLALNAGKTAPGRQIDLTITTNAMDSAMLPRALDFIASQQGDAYRVKSCFNGDLEILQGKQKVMRLSMQAVPGHQL